MCVSNILLHYLMYLIGSRFIGLVARVIPVVDNLKAGANAKYRGLMLLYSFAYDISDDIVWTIWKGEIPL